MGIKLVKIPDTGAVIPPKTLEDYITAVGQLVGGSGLPLGEPEKIFAIDTAVKQYSGHRPREITEDEAGNTTRDYAISLLAYWTEGFSEITKVQYPVDEDLKDDDWQIVRKPAGLYLRLVDSPAASEIMRIFYEALHTCTDDACTIPTYDEAAVQMLAAALFCEMLAAYFAQNQDSTIAADSVDHKSKSAEYQARAKAYRANYFSHLGIKDGENPAASVTKNQNVDGSYGDRITHSRRFR